MRKIICALLLSLLPLLPSASASAGGYRITEGQLTALENNLTALESDNQRLLRTLAGQRRELAQAKETSARQSKTLDELRGRLSEASRETASARQSLGTANAELANAAQSLKKSESRAKRIKRQRAFWQIAAVLFAGACGAVAAM